MRRPNVYWGQLLTATDVYWRNTQASSQNTWSGMLQRRVEAQGKRCGSSGEAQGKRVTFMGKRVRAHVFHHIIYHTGGFVRPDRLPPL